MLELSNKKKKFTKRNFKHLWIVELSRKTDLKPAVFRTLIVPFCHS